MISLVVLHYGRVDLTEACLRTVAQTASGYELVLVDNDPSYRCSHLYDFADTVVRNRGNAGFAKGCNQGASVATGDTLVFLNNDTEPRAGWLDALTGSLNGTVAAAGAKLIYPDGRIQHAGVNVYINSQGLIEAANRGRGCADAAPYDKPIEVDAVTGACLAVRRSAFDAVGGFNTDYFNGYEDVDLCLKLRDSGFSIGYQPKSVVMHHESASDPAERFRYIRGNVQLLQDRWRDKWLTPTS